MELKVDFGSPILDEETASAITPTVLDNYYASATATGRLDLFFELEASFHKYSSEGKNELASYLAFLIAYYVFVPLTPPASYDLALHYINEAIRLSPCSGNYARWLGIIKNGN